MKPRLRTYAVGLGALLLAGCAQGGGGPIAAPSPTAEPAPEPGLLVASATVLDDGAGPELCLGAIAQSLPPQCGGSPIDGWTWPASGVERVNGVTWGSFNVVGRYDGKRFTFDRLITDEQAAASLPPEEDRDFASPCPEPASGWRPVAPARSSQADQGRVFELAEKLDGFAGSWVDDRGDTAQPPETTVVNVRVTGSVEAAERKLRTVWGGPLCVSKARRSNAELERIQRALSDDPRVLGSSYDQSVNLDVSYDDGTMQHQLDATYGKGLVRVHSALRPYVG